MGKVLMILALVLGIWAAAQHMTGTSPFGDSEPRTSRASVARESGAKVQAAFDQGEQRRESMLEKSAR